jgi:hypothetical protein
MVLMLGVNSVNVNSITYSTPANPQALTHVFSTNGTFAVTGGFDVGEDIATLTLRGQYDSKNVDKIFTLAKSIGGQTGIGGTMGPPGSNLIPNGDFKYVNSTTGRLSSWDGNSTQHTYGYIGVNSDLGMIVNSRATTTMVFNDEWITINPYSEMIEVSVFLRAPTSGQHVYLSMDARDANRLKIESQRNHIDGFVRPWLNYAAGATSFRVRKPTSADLGWRGWDPTEDQNYLWFAQPTAVASPIYGADIYLWPHRLAVNTCIQITAISTAAANYDQLTLADGIPTACGTQDTLAVSRAGGTYRYWPGNMANAYAIVSSTWTQYTWRYFGVNNPIFRLGITNPIAEDRTFRPQTAAVRFGIGANAGGVNGPLHADNYFAVKRSYTAPGRLMHDPRCRGGAGSWHWQLGTMASYPAAVHALKFSATSGWSGWGCLVFTTGSGPGEAVSYRGDE